MLLLLISALLDSVRVEEKPRERRSLRLSSRPSLKLLRIPPSAVFR
jgi:hypothetical protein